MFCPVPLAAFCNNRNRGGNSSGNYDTDDEHEHEHSLSLSHPDHRKHDAACSSTAEETAATETTDHENDHFNENDHDTECDPSSLLLSSPPRRNREARQPPANETAPALAVATPDTVAIGGTTDGSLPLRFGLGVGGTTGNQHHHDAFAVGVGVSPVRPRAVLFEKSMSRAMLPLQDPQPHNTGRNKRIDIDIDIDAEATASKTMVLETENNSSDSDEDDDNDDYQEAVVSPLGFVLLAIGIALIHSLTHSHGISIHNNSSSSSNSGVARYRHGNPAPLSPPYAGVGVGADANANHAVWNPPRAPVPVGDTSSDASWLFHNTTGSRNILTAAASRASTATRVATKKIVEATTGAKIVTTTTTTTPKKRAPSETSEDESSSLPAVPAALWSYLLAGSGSSTPPPAKKKKVQFFPLLSGLDRYLENRLRAAGSGLWKASEAVQRHRIRRAGKRDSWKEEQRRSNERRRRTARDE